jgi:hypothetical protein
VHVREDGKWLMAFVHESKSEPTDGGRSLGDLDWLVGTWAGEEFGATTEVTCRWLPSKSFLERKYSVTTPDGHTIGGIQFVGMNSQTGRITSWNFNFDGSQIAMMAWNGSNGLVAGQPDYVPYTAWRNTPGDDALVDFLVDHADLPRGARVWTFGTSRHADDDGWSLDQGRLVAGRGFADLTVDTAAALMSPGDQVLRAGEVDTLVLGIAEPAGLDRVQVFARTGDGAQWTAISASAAATELRRSAAGIEVPLAWPPEWRAEGAIADRVRIALTAATARSKVRVHRIALYPRDGGP